MDNEKEECTLKRLFDYLYPTDMWFEYRSTSADGAYIKVLLYNDVWVTVYPYIDNTFKVVHHDNNENPKEKVLYWSYKDLIEYLCINYEG